MKKKHIEEYLERKKISWSSTTLQSVKSRLNRFLSLNTENPAKCYEQLKSQGMNGYSIKTLFINVAKLYDFFKKPNLFRTFMAESPQLFRNVYQDKETTLTLEEFFEELNVAKGSVKDALILMGMGGCRFVELATYDGQCVIGKGKKKRKIFLPPKMKPAPVFLNYTVLCKQLKRTPHEYRKLAADTWFRNGIDIKTVSKLLGHSSLASTQRYLRGMEEEELQGKVSEAWNEE